ncbi:MAG: hypothetical protein KatS3mg112_1340 [Thermogutta sp.]|nr:MAG: hypothetical protein KatS3mg112_1340 [Thermogutta sp.]
MNGPYLTSSAPSEGPACQVRLPEGPACQVRWTPIDDTILFLGHDERAPPTFSGGTRLSGPPFQRWIIHCLSSGTTSVPLRPFPEGPACRVRLSNAGSSIAFPGHDERAPPTFSGGTRLSGPPFQRWIIHCLSSGTTSVPLRPFPEGPACRVRLSNAGSSIAFPRARRACPSRGRRGRRPSNMRKLRPGRGTPCSPSPPFSPLRKLPWTPLHACR